MELIMLIIISCLMTILQLHNYVVIPPPQHLYLLAENHKDSHDKIGMNNEEVTDIQRLRVIPNPNPNILSNGYYMVTYMRVYYFVSASLFYSSIIFTSSNISHLFFLYMNTFLSMITYMYGC